MLSRAVSRLSLLVLFAGILAPGASYAVCTMPNILANGQTTDATKIMGNFGALSTCLDNNGSVNAGTAGQVGVYDTSGNDISGKSLSNILDSSISSTQGTILYRGSSGWQGLAPGTAGYVLGTNGAGADPLWVPQSGGGGGKAQAFPGGFSSWSVSKSAAANVVEIADDISVSNLAAMFSPVTGGTYKMGIAGWDSATSKIMSTPVYTASQTVATGGGLVPVYFSFSFPVAVTAGKHVVMLIRTDGTTTTSLGLFYGGQFWAPQVFMANSGTIYSLASQAPTTSDVWTYDGSGAWNFAMMYTY